jgi:hypothetical protein
MPWHISKRPGDCGKAKPWAVVQDSTGKVVGCHTSKADAQKQMAALYANVLSLPDKP